MFAQWWRDIKVCSLVFILRLPTWTGRGFDKPPLRKLKRWQQPLPDRVETSRIYDPETGGFYTTHFATDFEFVDPIEFYKQSSIKISTTMQRDILLLKGLPLLPESIKELIHKQSLEWWDEQYKRVLEAEAPENLLAVLSLQSKKEQVLKLKGVQINPDQLLNFLFKASTDYGFKFSQYTAEHQPTGTDKKDLPTMVNVKDGKVKKIGNTSLTDGQIKQILEHRKVTIAKFLDNQESWHCLFTTFNSLKGAETWKGGQPHYHYISDKFGLPRDKVVQELKNRDYKLGSLPHIDLLDYKL